eukprot:GFYU01016189.1.p1 GENE.GFYU01016189.1~~GFYU01016189.1.p1  ORF type:complete len:298 (-),score=48.53 GFYU01016189.1:153-1046(-)
MSFYLPKVKQQQTDFRFLLPLNKDQRKQALEFAITLASHFNAHLTLMVAKPQSKFSCLGTSTIKDNSIINYDKKIRRILEEASKLAKDEEVDFSVAPLRMNEGQAIIHAQTECHYIIMGVKSAYQVKRATDLLKWLTIPIVFVKPSHKTFPVKSLLVPFDGSPISKNVVTHSLAWARLLDEDATVEFVYVGNNQMNIKVVEDELDEILDLAADKDVNATKVVIETDPKDLVKTIVELSANVDCVLLGSTCRKSSSLFGSGEVVSQRVVNIVKGARCPAWVYIDHVVDVHIPSSNARI